MTEKKRYDCRTTIADLIFADTPEEAKDEFVDRYDLNKLPAQVEVEVTEIPTVNKFSVKSDVEAEAKT